MAATLGIVLPPGSELGPNPPGSGIFEDVPYAAVACFLTALVIYLAMRISRRKCRPVALSPAFWYLIASGVGLLLWPVLQLALEALLSGTGYHVQH
jgi:hypothetical protein